jgi:tetratricopeptide (TPR) repeat protein
MAVIVGSGQSKKKWWVPVLYVVGALVLAGGVGAGVRFLQNKSEDKKPDTTQQEPQDLPDQVVRIQDLAASGQYDTAQKEINEALKKPNVSDGQKFDLYFQQGIVYQTQEKFAQALASYQQAEKVEETRSVSEAVAEIAVLLGKTDLAIEYYKKVITQLDENSTVYDADKDAFEAKISSLEEQQ